MTNAIHASDALKIRIDAATSAPNKWNNWPDLMELVKVERFDLEIAKRAYEAGQLFGNYDTARQIAPNMFPAQLYPTPRTYTMTHFRYAYEKGQMDSIETRNIFAMFEYHDIHSYQPTELIVAEIGCKHDYDRTGSRMCLSQGTCRKCGHKFLCDSGD